MNELQSVLSARRYPDDRCVAQSVQDFLQRFKDSGTFDTWLEIFKRPMPYSIYNHDLSYIQGRGEKFDMGFYFDSEHQFLLHDVGLSGRYEPAFCVGFDTSPDPTGIFTRFIHKGDVLITQIQRQKNVRFAPRYKEYLDKYGTSLRVEKFLVSLVGRWARESGFKRVTILGASKNMWSRGDEARAENLHRIYDGTARSLGFKKSPLGVWVLDLQKDPE